MRAVLKSGKPARSIILLIAAGALLLGAAGVWQKSRASSKIEAAIPPRPAMEDRLPELTFRIEQTEDAARKGGSDAIAALGRLARIYHANAFRRQAVALYEALSTMEPEEVHWPYLHADILIRYGQTASAVPLLERSVELAPDYAPAQLRLADALTRSGETDAALATYHGLVAKEPENPFALLALARVNIAEENWDLAADRLLRATKADPRFGAAWSLLASVYQAQGKTDASLDARTRAQEVPPKNTARDPWIDALMDSSYDPYQLRVAADSAFLRDEPEEAARLIQRALRLDPQDGSSHLLYAKLLIRAGDSATARDHLQHAVRLGSNDSETWLALINLILSQGDSVGLDRALAEGLSQQPESSGLRFAEGLRLAHLGELAAAEIQLQEASRLAPDEAMIHIVLAQVLFRRGKSREGTEAMESALVINPHHPQALTSMAHYAINDGDPARARHFIFRALAEDSSPPDELALLAQRFHRKFGEAP